MSPLSESNSPYSRKNDKQEAFDKEIDSFLNTTLPLVSRTFAINIRALPKKQRREITIAYLLCRIIDSIEDDPTLSDETKVNSLRAFPALLEKSSTTINAQKLRAQRWYKQIKHCSPKPAEKILLEKVAVVVQAFHYLEREVRASMLKPISRMANGMAKVIAKHKTDSLKNIPTLTDLLQYCYYVAGTVGELLSCLYLVRGRLNTKKSISNNTAQQEFLKNGVDFGIGLQLTNILKDFNDDSNRGWLYIPKDMLLQAGITPKQFLAKKSPSANKAVQLKLIALAEQKLENGIVYLKTLPFTAYHYRLFCLLPLAMAYRTLALLSQQPISQDKQYRHKISKKVLVGIVISCYVAAATKFSSSILCIILKRHNIT